MKTQVMWGLALLSLATVGGAWAQDAIVGEKGIVGEKRPADDEAIIGEKRPGGEQGVIGEKNRSANAVVGEKGVVAGKGRAGQQRTGSSTPALSPEVSRLLRQETAAVRYRPAALKLQQLPTEIRSLQLQASDLGTPFRIEPATRPGADRQWYASRVASLSSAMDGIELVYDGSGTRTSGHFGLVFPVHAGYRYLVDCAVAHAGEFVVSHTGLGPPANAARVTTGGNLASLVSAPVTDGGRAWVEFKASRAQSAAWQWRGCEVTPLRVR